ncbi:ABC transporter substrate-binding protein [Priestia koreensis]|uniref:ABC transporter substrate-binding protein n=1 Tax=Priestia koreensis TaxID=284581 RepID=UPI00203A736D|nr:ABC transporter substrate-binding protein [Priestia koreensis]MCM3004482.1 ABC transporter substrate-binding protein [Priestia koreensis]
MKRTYSTLLAVFTALLLVVLAACGNSSDNKSESKDDSKSAATYTVKHTMGTSKIKENPKRIVVLTNEGTEALLSMGVTPVGAVQSWAGNPWYDHIKKDMKDVKSVGTESEPSLETIASLKPDLIIGNKQRQEKIYDQLNAIAPTVFSDELRGDWKENFKLYAKAVNKEEKGNKVIADFDQRIEDLKGKLGDKLQQKVSIVRFTAGDVRIYHKDSFSGVILDQLGFARPESQDKPDFAEMNATKERIPAMDGDVLFYFAYDPANKEVSSLQKEWLNDPLFKKLNVSQKGNVHEVDDSIWNTAGGVIAANLMLDDIEKYFLQSK